MDEKDFGQKITRTLNWGLSRIEDDKLAKLRAGRQRALDAYREPVTVLGLVTVSGQTLDVSGWLRKPLFWLPILAITVAIATYSLNGADDDTDEDHWKEALDPEATVEPELHQQRAEQRRRQDHQRGNAADLAAQLPRHVFLRPRPDRRFGQRTAD